MGTTYKQFLSQGGLLPQQNIAARQSAISAAHPRLAPAQVQQRATQQVFQSFQRAGQLGNLLPGLSQPLTQYGDNGMTQYSAPGYTNNGPTDAQYQATTGGSGTGDLSSAGTGLATPATTVAPTGVFGFFSALPPMQQYLLIAGIIGIGGFLLYREFRK